MKKIFSLLLLCILVFSITVSLTSCWWKNQNQGNNDDDNVQTDPTPDPDPTPDDDTIDIDGGTTNNGIELPPVTIPSKNGQE